MARKVVLISVVLVATLYSTFSAVPPPRIVGGDSATISQYPSLGSLQIRPRGLFQKWGHICGCTIVANDKVVTAAHCVVNYLISYWFFEPYEMRVVVGTSSLNDTAAKAYAVLQDKSGYHEKYGVPLKYSNDIAVLTTEPIALTPNVQKAAILHPDSPLKPSNMSIAGWGSTQEGGGLVNEMRHAIVDIYTHQECTNAYSAADIDVSMLCAGFDEGEIDSCQGDSGGPLITKANDKQCLGGVVSWGYGCARRGKPGVYCNVHNRLIYDWIVSKVPDLEKC